MHYVMRKPGAPRFDLRAAQAESHAAQLRKAGLVAFGVAPVGLGPRLRSRPESRHGRVKKSVRGREPGLRGYPGRDARERGRLGKDAVNNFGEIGVNGKDVDIIYSSPRGLGPSELIVSNDTSPEGGSSFSGLSR